MGPRSTGRSSRVRAAVRWLGRVLLHGAGAGGAHGATLFAGAWLAVLAGIATAPSGAGPPADQARLLAMFVAFGAAAGVATGVVVGLLSAPAAAVPRWWAHRRVRTAVWVVPAVAWLVVSLTVTGIDDGWTSVWWLNLGPAVWIAVGMRRLVGRWDPAQAGRPRPPLPRHQPGPARFPK